MGYLHTWDGIGDDIKILPMSGIKILSIVDDDPDDEDAIDFPLLESDSTFSIRAIMSPTDRGGSRVQALTVEANAIIAQNVYEFMANDFTSLMTWKVSNVEITLAPLEGQEGGGVMKIHVRNPGLAIRQWEIAEFKIDSAGPRPRTTLRIVGVFSLDAFVNASPTGLFNQISGF